MRTLETSPIYLDYSVPRIMEGNIEHYKRWANTAFPFPAIQLEDDLLWIGACLHSTFSGFLAFSNLKPQAHSLFDVTNLQWSLVMYTLQTYLLQTIVLNPELPLDSNTVNNSEFYKWARGCLPEDSTVQLELSALEMLSAFDMIRASPFYLSVPTAHAGALYAHTLIRFPPDEDT